ncbi:hypothetical protein JOD55_001431 [Arcanobacterium pluranimalium]|uniref:hypothetical protein n=1 Tax=Arcanobacterium pluranimalium TaxID=108028 RepID=UPI00195D17C5|nr:hypothetical protein [Arcanobacterium pluranimalium]MBM7825604.1 hypothetical protein [Arcanobacterium pluranimalium]
MVFYGNLFKIYQRKFGGGIFEVLACDGEQNPSGSAVAEKFWGDWRNFCIYIEKLRQSPQKITPKNIEATLSIASIQNKTI